MIFVPNGRQSPDFVVVLDLDDTLYLERDYVESGLNAVGCWVESQLARPALGSLMIDLFRQGIRGNIFDLALAEAGLAGRPDLIARMVQVYRQHRPQIDLTADAKRLFARRPDRVAFALITDGYIDAQKRKMRALRLHAQGLSLGICTDRWGRADWKPSERAFRHVQAIFGVPPQALVYVADNPNKDFHAPRRLGWRTLQIKRPGRLHTRIESFAESADAEIETLDEIAP
ncbi:HAD family hydrolase [Flavisphingomonas formosensis]|uniref:HAD family hydrolase n=1 Tax=Flavisphingomonas formosensis TaxID=861534 RepID=UPI001E39E4AA|nr:HAD family hydrolase [Sphingomonas formosensis]